MRTLLAAMVVVAACAGLAWWTFADERAAPPAPAEPDALAPAPDAGAAAQAAATAGAREEAAAPPQAPAHAAPAGDEAPGAAPAPAAPGPVVVHVTELTSRAALAPFRWSFRTFSETLRGEADESPCALPLPHGVVGELMIEVDAHQPFRKAALAVPRVGWPALRVDAALLPAVERAGITLVVTDPDAAPAADVRVDAFALTPKQEGAAWHLGAALWSRRASADDGVYALPQLPAGSFGVQLVALDAEGAPRPLAAWRSTFRLDGSNGFLDHVALEPACALRLDLRDPTLAPLAPAAIGDVGITLRRPAEPALQRVWVASDREGRGQVTAIDALPGRAPTWLAAPARPGAYELTVTIGGVVRAQRALVLRPEAQTEQVVVY